MQLPAALSAVRLGVRVLLALATLMASAVPAAAYGEQAISGRIVLDHADAFGDGRAADYPILETGTDRLALVGIASEDVAPGQRVRIVGRRSGQTFVVSDGRRSVSADSPSPEAPATSTDVIPTNVRRVAVLLINFIDDAAVPALPNPPLEPWTREQVHELYFTGSKSVAAYYSELSDGQMAITGDVFGYFTLNTNTRVCDYSDWGTAAQQAASAQGIDLAAYTNVVHAFAQRQSCWWQGLAVVPGTKNWINGAMNLYVAAHELGHNFGVHHASSVDCVSGETRVSFSSDCRKDEYGDPFDIIGYTAPRQMSGWHRQQLGFLPGDELQTVTADGTYRLAPVADPSGDAPRTLRIRRPAGDYWNVEFRQPRGPFDDFPVLANAVNGVMIRLAPDASVVTRSRLIDTTPETASFLDAPLEVGASFFDPVGKVSISLESIGPTGASLEVRFGAAVSPPADPPSDDVTPPSPPEIFVATLTGADQALLSWSASSDDVAVAHYLVSIDGLPYARTREQHLDAVRLDDGVAYALAVRAVDAAGNASEEATQQLVVPDVTPPKRLAGLSGARLSANEVRLTWRAGEDNIGVTAYRVYRDGVPFATAPGDATIFFDTSVVAGHRYSYAVGALDAVGNLGITAITSVSATAVDVTPPSVPTDLAAASLGRRRVALSWSASTDDSGGSIRYFVFRGRKRIAVVTTTSYTDRPARKGSYRYRVRAVDASGNKSPFSEPVVGVASRKAPSG